LEVGVVSLNFVLIRGIFCDWLFSDDIDNWCCFLV